MSEPLRTLWSVRYKNHVFVFWRGEIIYKNYDRQLDGYKPCSVLFNKHWPNERIHKDSEPS